MPFLEGAVCCGVSRTNAFLDVFERLERVATRLPAPMQEPVLREIAPVKELFLMRRAPRMAVAAPNPAIWARTLNVLAHRRLISESQAHGIDAAQSWIAVRDGRPGVLEVGSAGSPALTAADLVVVVVDAADRDAGRTTRELARRALTVRQTAKHEAEEQPAPVLGIVLAPDGADAVRVQTQLNDALRAETIAGARLIATVILAENLEQPVSTMQQPQPFDGSAASVAALIVRELPLPTRLEAARLFSAREAQEDISRTLIKSVSALAGLIGAQPLPLADFPVLLAMQCGMIAGVVHIGGGQPGPLLLGRFLAAMGFNLAAAVVFREGARGLSKFFPGWGQAIGSGVAAMGTYAIGMAAQAHFIRGAGLAEARALLRRPLLALPAPKKRAKDSAPGRK